MVRIRRQNTDNPSIPVRSPGIRRRYLLRERIGRNLGPSNNSSTQERTNDIPIEDLTISPITTSYSPLSIADVIEEPSDIYAEEFQEIGDPTELEVLLTTEITVGEIPRAWETGQAPTVDKQTQCSEEDFSLLSPPISPNYSPLIEFPEPSYSPIYTREYSPVLTPFPRWYLLPEEYELELMNYEDTFIDHEDSS